MSFEAGLKMLEETLNVLLEELHDGVEWENDNLASYLTALHALVPDMPLTYENVHEAVPTDPWRVVCDALLGAREYE